MSRTAHHSHGVRPSTWRDAYDVTESQACALVALMSAQHLFYDGATTKAMRSLGLTATEAHSVSALQHVGLVEVVGYVEGTRECIYRATERAFRRFGVEVPRTLGSVIETVAERAEAIAQRKRELDARRSKAWRERKERQRESA